MSRKREDILFIIVVAILLTVAILLGLRYIRIPYNVNRSLSGIRFWTGDEEAQGEPVTIEIYGTYYKYIVHFPNVSDYFEGEVILSDIEYTSKDILRKVFLHDAPSGYDKHYGKYGVLDYLDNGVLGYIHENDNFSNVIVEISDRDGEETVYVFPTDNIEKAREEERYLHYLN